MVFKCISQTNINGAFTCALVKDRDMGNFMGGKWEEEGNSSFAICGAYPQNIIRATFKS